MIAIDLFYLFVAIDFDFLRGIYYHPGAQTEVQSRVDFDANLLIQTFDRRFLYYDLRLDVGEFELANFKTIGQIHVIQNDDAERAEQDGVCF